MVHRQHQRERPLSDPRSRRSRKKKRESLNTPVGDTSELPASSPAAHCIEMVPIVDSQQHKSGGTQSRSESPPRNSIPSYLLGDADSPVFYDNDTEDAQSPSSPSSSKITKSRKFRKAVRRGKSAPQDINRRPERKPPYTSDPREPMEIDSPRYSPVLYRHSLPATRSDTEEALDKYMQHKQRVQKKGGAAATGRQSPLAPLELSSPSSYKETSPEYEGEFFGLDSAKITQKPLRSKSARSASRTTSDAITNSPNAADVNRRYSYNQSDIRRRKLQQLSGGLSLRCKELPSSDEPDSTSIPNSPRNAHPKDLQVESVINNGEPKALSQTSQHEDKDPVSSALTELERQVISGNQVAANSH